jgi:AAA ATPase domain
MIPDIGRLFQQCDPAKPLGPDDPRYVPCDDARGEDDLVIQLTNAIRWSDSSLHLLYAGHRGAGKSTELLRLKRNLEKPPEGEGKFFVIYFEADTEDIDVNDADFADVLLAIIRELGKSLRDKAQIELGSSWFSKFLGDLKTLLGSEVEFEKLEFDAKIAKFTAAIKSSPDARRKIRDALEPNVSNLIEAGNELLDEAVTQLRIKGYKDLVIIVDNLDRIVLRDIPNSQFNTHEQLFINRGAQLAQLRAHVLYTLPISMVFSPKATALVNIFGRQPAVLPMVKVITPDNKDCEPGMDAMRKIVEKRLTAAGVEADKAFDKPETLTYLCRASGGHPRNLLILIRSACTASTTLPLTLRAAEQSVRRMTTDFERALNSPKFFDTLREVNDTRKLPGSEYDQLLLYNLSVLEYLNGNPWYAVNPAVLLLPVFQRAKTRKSVSHRKAS